jgi:two-component sensor histidine kinase
MTEREWPIVEELINTISPQLSEPRAKQVFQEIIDRFKSMENASVDFYETEWRDSDFYKPLTKNKKDDPLGLGI